LDEKSKPDFLFPADGRQKFKAAFFFEARQPPPGNLFLQRRSLNPLLSFGRSKA